MRVLLRYGTGAALVLASLGLFVFAFGRTGGSPAAARVARTRVPVSSTTAAASRPAPEHGARQSERADPLGAAEAFVTARSGVVLAAVYDVRTGQVWTSGEVGPAQDEASIVKLDILEALLAQRPAGLPATDQALAQRMIERSDNDAATTLWYAAGGTAGLREFNATLGLTGTVPSYCVQCPGFPWPGWGLSTTTPRDQLTLLRELVSPNRLLSDSDRAFALGLMENVDPTQRWGISGGVPAAATVALKDGWLPLNAAATDWQINSIGWVSGLGRDYLIAVMTTGNPSEQYGIDTIDGLAAIVWKHLPG